MKPSLIIRAAKSDSDTQFEDTVPTGTLGTENTNQGDVFYLRNITVDESTHTIGPVQYDEYGADTKYVFNQGVVPTDLCCDNKDNLWVSTTNKFRNILYSNGLDIPSIPQRDGGDSGVLSFAMTGIQFEQYKTDFENTTKLLGGVSARKEGGEFIYKFPDLDSTEMGSIHTGSLISLTGLSAGSDRYYEGLYLVNSVSAHPTSEVRVQPYLGVYNNAPDNTHKSQPLTNTNQLSSCQIFVYPSDKIYKFDASGSLLFAISGFVNPQHIITDTSQNIWVSHNANTLTQINTAGKILQSILVEDNIWNANFLSAGAKPVMDTLIYSNSAAHMSHIGGVSFDAYNKLLVVNSFGK